MAGLVRSESGAGSGQTPATLRPMMRLRMLLLPLVLVVAACEEPSDVDGDTFDAVLPRVGATFTRTWRATATSGGEVGVTLTVLPTVRGVVKTPGRVHVLWEALEPDGPRTLVDSEREAHETTNGVSMPARSSERFPEGGSFRLTLKRLDEETNMLIASVDVFVWTQDGSILKFERVTP